jgi:16S rRNA (adenine1518-N6/adenine1519-N6)-dimethyltransferase
MTRPEDLPPLREVIAEHGLGAKKAFGQHFLLDLNMTAKIARLAGDMSGETALEIGPGPGGLTRAILAEGPARLIAVEKDPRFFGALQDLSAAYENRLELIEADALTVDETALPGGAPELILSNLPYNVGTPLFIKWLSAEPAYWRVMVLMFQLEVAQRITARPGEKAYGRLGVMAQSRAQCRLAVKVPARAFTPPPKVDSAVITATPLPEGERFQDVEALEAVTASAFGQRRKTLRRSLAQAASQTGASAEELLQSAGIAPEARAETIEVKGFQALAKAWRAAKS